MSTIPPRMYSEPPEAPGAHPIHVLMVDDQPIMGEAVRRMLAAEKGVQVHLCLNSAEALETAKAFRPTVILQDLVMPGKGGLELVAEYRACEETREIPLIVLSTKEEPAIKKKAFALGANDYIVKLPDPLELIARIRYHSKAYTLLLERNEAHQALVESREQLAKTNAFIRDAFGRYVANEVVDAVLATPDGVKLGGDRRVVTIIVADLRGFTQLAERLPPESVLLFINTFLEVMTDVLAEYRGTIVDIAGDAILAVFGAPVQREDDAERAVACSIAMQLAMARVNEENARAGLPAAQMGIGIHTGSVIAGNVGSMKRTKYGVVGNSVNVASRVESSTVGGQILLTDETRLHSRAPLSLGDTFEVLPKGVKRPMTLHEVLGVGAPYHLALPRRTEPLAVLPEPMDVRLAMFLDKRASGAFALGRIVEASSTDLVIATDAQFGALADLKIALLGEPDAPEIHGKVTREEPGRLVVRITSSSPEAATRLQEARR